MCNVGINIVLCAHVYGNLRVDRHSGKGMRVPLICQARIMMLDSREVASEGLSEIAGSPGAFFLPFRMFV